MIDPRRLLIFEAVARAGSFTRAASLLHLSQPSVSRQVAELERECRLTLIERHARGLVLTAAGAALCDRATAVRAELSAADASVTAFLRGETGVVRTTAFTTAATALAAPAIGLLRRSHPGIRATLREAGRELSLRLLRDGEADLALIFDRSGEEPGDLAGLATTTLLEESFLVALPPGHKLAEKEALDLRALEDEEWVTGTAAAGLIERACHAAGFEPRIVARADDQPTIQALVAGGIAVTLVPQLAASTRSDIVFRPLRPARVRRRISAVMLNVTYRAPAVAALLSRLAEVASVVAGEGALGRSVLGFSRQTARGTRLPET